MDPLDELLTVPGAAGDVARERFEQRPLVGEMPDDTATRLATTARVQATAQRNVNRLKAGDLAQRRIPSYTDPTGNVQPVTDPTGAPVTNYDKGANVGYDSGGRPVQLRYSADGPPAVEDAFAGIPVTTDRKTGDQYRIRKGLPWEWVGKDKPTADAAAEREKEKLVQQTATTMGRKLTLDERQLVRDRKDYEAHTKKLAEQFGLTGEEDFDTAVAMIEQQFNNEVDGYGSPAANDTEGWFGGELTPEAMKVRAAIDARKADAMMRLGAIRNAREQIGLRQQHVAGQQAQRDALLREQNNAAIAKLHEQGVDIPGITDQPSAPQPQGGTAPGEAHNPAADGSIPSPATPSATPQEEADLYETGTPEDIAAILAPSTAPQATIGQKVGNAVGALVRGFASLPKDMGEAIGLLTSRIDSLLPELVQTGAANQKPEETLTGEIGNAISEFAERMFPEDPALRSDFIFNKVPQALGQAAGFMAGGLLTKSRYIVPALLGAGAGMSEGYRDAMKHGASEDDAFKAALANGGVGLTEIVPISSLITRWDRATGGALKLTLREAMIRGAAETFEEAVQEAFQSTAGNAIAQQIYDADRPLFQGAAEGAAVGGTVGAILSAITSAVIGIKQRRMGDTAPEAEPTGSGTPPAAPPSAPPGPPPSGPSGPPTSTPPSPPPATSSSAPAPTGTVGTPPSLTPAEQAAKDAAGSLFEDETPVSPATSAGATPTTTGAAPAPPVEGSPTRPGVAPPDTNASPVVEPGSGSDTPPAETTTPQPEQPPPPAGAAPEPTQPTAPATEGAPPADAPTGATVDTAANGAATSPTNDLPEPTDPQKQAGNYKVGRVRVSGLDISIENPAGSTRSGIDKAGNKWSVTMQDHYGYIRGSKGKDGDHIDIFIKPGTTPDYEGPVYVVNQHDADGKFDEHKAVLGASSAAEARSLYERNYNKGKAGRGSVVGFSSVESFKRWATGASRRLAPARGDDAATTSPETEATVPPPSSTGEPGAAGGEAAEILRQLKDKLAEQERAGGPVDDRLVSQIRDLENQLKIKEGDWIEFTDDYGKNRSGRVSQVWRVGKIIPGQKTTPQEEYAVEDAQGNPVGTAEAKHNPRKIAPPTSNENPRPPKDQTPAGPKGADVPAPQPPSGGGTSPRPAESAQAIEDEIARWKGPLLKLGVSLRERRTSLTGRDSKIDPPMPAGIALDWQAREIVFDPNRLATIMRVMDEHAADPRAWLHAAFNEEFVHALDLATSGADQFGTWHAEQWASLSSEVRDDLRGVYPELANLPGPQAARTGIVELMRMLYQLGTLGTMTEQHSLGADEATAFAEKLRSLELPDAIGRHLREMRRNGLALQEGKDVTLPPEPEPQTSPAVAASDLILERLRKPGAFDWRELFEMTDRGFGGTQAQGKYSVKDAYDALELAVNRYLRGDKVIGKLWPDAGAARITINAIKSLILDRIPTQTKRTEEQDKHQQFSTPPQLAFLANWVADVREGDIMLEPSAGIGGLAVFAKNAGATVITNELSARRREYLSALGFDHMLGENAEQLHAILTPRIQRGELPRPTVVVMNPPFSNAAKSGERGNTKIGAQHVEEALKLLEDNGRLVAIVGEGMTLDKPTFRAWWDRIGKQYHVRAVVWMNGKNYTKYGTSFDNALLVIDKRRPPSGWSWSQVVTGKVDDLTELPTLLKEVRNDRPNTSAQPPSNEDAGTGGSAGSNRPPQPAPDAPRPPSRPPRGAGGGGKRPGQPDDRPGAPKPGGNDAPPVGSDQPGGTGGTQPGGSGPAGGKPPVGGSGPGLTAAEQAAKDAAGDLFGASDPTAPSRRGRNATLEQAARDLREGRITRDQYDAVVREQKPVRPLSAIPSVPTDEQLRDALSQDRAPLVGAARELASGTPVGLRIDIPAFQRSGRYVITIHEGAEKGKVGKRIGYDGMAIVRNPRFFVTSQKLSQSIATGDAPKAPLATVEGEFIRQRDIPRDTINWTQAGYDPERHGYFYDRRTGRPVTGGSYAVAVGNTVFVRDATFGDAGTFLYASDPTRLDSYETPIPPERRPAMIAAFMALGAEANTPEKFAAALLKLGPKAPAFSQTLWYLAKSGGATGADRPNWSEVYTALKPKKDEQPTDAPPEEQPAQPPEGEIKIDKQDKRKAAETDEGGVFATYHPSKLHIPGAKPHPAELVESAAMASVSTPDPTYTPNLPKEIIENGLLSEAQLENVVYAGQAHQQTLETGERRGYFIGDGTGVGKGRQIGGIFLDNQRQGRTKGVWVSKSSALIKDAKRDAADVGLDPDKLLPLGKVKKGQDIKVGDGIMFTSYDTLKGGHEGITGRVLDWVNRLLGREPDSRIEQLVRWLGKDFDGVIAFDESHMAGNAIPIRGPRGMKDASRNGIAVVDLQRALPNARIVYVSATGATEVENLSYADRLGIWGPGTSFSDKREFFNKIAAGGLSAMEIVARDLKAMGLYLARSISYRGVEFARLTQNLTSDQRELYDNIATKWQEVLANVDEAMGDSGANNSAQARSSALSAFWGAQQRFFNQLLTAMEMPALLSDMDEQLASDKSVVLQLVNTNEATQERQIARRKTEEGADASMEDLDLSPKDILRQYIATCFPTAMYEPVADPNDPDKVTWQPVRDSDGNVVHDPAAIEKRDRMLDEIEFLQIPENPLEQILNRFGSENVAEVTGRSQRIVEQKQDDGTRKPGVIERRNEHNRAAEAQEFQDGKRRILIFSQAGGTGFSFHADRRAKNQQKRIHYLVQAGWRADTALQGFGRTHRTNQEHTPFYKLVETSVPGHKRFISTIARRLAQLGALTTGERKSTGQGMFNESDNLEGRYADDAIMRLVFDLFNGNTSGANDGLTLNDFARQFGYLKTVTNPNTGETETRNVLIDQSTGALNQDKIPSVPVFLNRILANTLEAQNQYFGMFMDRLERRIAAAKADGTFDPGTQQYPAERMEKRDDQVVYRHPGTAAETRIVELDAYNPVEFTKFDDIDRLSENPVIHYGRNRKSGNVYAFRDAPSKTLDDGRVVPTYRRLGTHSTEIMPTFDVRFDDPPTPIKVGDTFERVNGLWTVTQLPTKENPNLRIMGSFVDKDGKFHPEREWHAMSTNAAHDMQYIAREYRRFVPGVNEKADYIPKSGGYEKLTKEQAREAWDAEIERSPKEKAKRVTFLVGAMLPIWDRIQLPQPRIFRFTTHEGDPMLGVQVPEDEVPGLRSRLGASNNMTPAQAFALVLNDGARLKLANGWVIRRAYVSSEDRIEVEGMNFTQSRDFIDRMGGFSERIQHRPRFFVRTDEQAGTETFRMLMQQSPIAEINGNVVGASNPLRPGDRVRVHGKTGRVTRVKGKRLIIALDEGGNVPGNIDNVEVIPDASPEGRAAAAAETATVPAPERSDRAREFRDERRRDLADLWTSTIDAVRSVGASARHFFTSLKKIDDYWRAKGHWLGTGDPKDPRATGRQRSDFEVRRMERAIDAKFSGPTQEAVTNYIQAGGDRGLLQERASQSRDRYRKGYERAANLTTEELALVEAAKRFYEEKAEQAQEAGLLDELLEDYVNQLWSRRGRNDRRSEEERTRVLGTIQTARLKTKFDNALHRVLESYFAGEQHGLDPHTKRIGKLMAVYAESFNRVMSNRKFVSQLAHDINASDGRPAAIVSGYGKPVGEAPSALLVKPRSKPGEYADYVYIPNAALRGWKWIHKDAATGRETFVEGDMLVHPEFADDLRRTIGSSALQQIGWFRTVRNIQFGVKQTLLGLSGFHWVQEGTHAVGHRVNPFPGLRIPGLATIVKLDMNDERQRELINGGMMIASYEARRDFMEGVASSGIIDKLPVLGRFNEWLNAALFEDYIPRLKMTMGLHALERNLKRFSKQIAAGTITREQIVWKTAQQANDAFGEQNWRLMGASQTALDVMRATMLAPDFLISRLKFAADATTRYGGEQLQALGLLAMAMFILAKAIEKMLTGDMELEKPFSVTYEGREYKLRSVPGDIIELFHDTRRFVYGRLSPLIGRGVIEWLTGRDWRGQKRTGFEQLQDLVKSPIPIALRGIVDQRSDITAGEQLASSLGAHIKRQSDVIDTRRLGHEWRQDKGKESTDEVHPPSRYLPLRHALEDGDRAKVRKAFVALAKEQGREQTLDGFRQSIMRPFSGSKADEPEFLRSLSPHDRALYERAQRKRARMMALLTSVAASVPSSEAPAKPKRSASRSPSASRDLMFTGFN